MRIQRSALFIAQQIAKGLFQKTTVIAACLIVGGAGAIIGQNILTTPYISYAATPADSCFSFDSAAHTINGYYSNEADNPANPACPKSVDIPATIGGSAVTAIGNSAFISKQLTAITIPNSVTSIGNFAFSTNQLMSVVIPNSVTSIGISAFASNNLASVTLSTGMARIENGVFRNNNLTELTIPNNITSIGTGAFYDNSLAALVIPDTITAIDAWAFEANQLTSVTLGCGINSIGNEVFAINKLREVTVPDCITSINPTTFMGQNSWGGVIDTSTDPAHDWFSADSSVVQTVLDNIWYVKLYTSNSTNPNHLTDGATNESWYTGDINGDGDMMDSIGGHLINPASATVKYVDGAGASLLPDHASVGRIGGSTDVADYLVKNIQIPDIADASAPTTAEQSALDASFAPYYRIGQSVPITAPNITGYTLQAPSSPYAVNLVSANNTATFTYATSQATPPTPNPTVTPPIVQPAPAATPSKNTSTTNASSNKATTTPQESTDTATTPVKIARTKIDFASESGSATNPTPGAVPSNLAAIMTKSSLAVDETKACSQIESARLLSNTSFTAPESSHTTLGGLAFVLSCAAAGGDAKVTFTLGDRIADLSKVKIYKQNILGVKDITAQVNLTNQTDSGHTNISYTLQDGHALDDDGLANSSITDPIYLAVQNEAKVSLPIHQAASQPKQQNTAIITGIIAAILGIVGVVIVRKLRKSQ